MLNFNIEGVPERILVKYYDENGEEHIVKAEIGEFGEAHIKYNVFYDWDEYKVMIDSDFAEMVEDIINNSPKFELVVNGGELIVSGDVE